MTLKVNRNIDFLVDDDNNLVGYQKAPGNAVNLVTAQTNLTGKVRFSGGTSADLLADVIYPPVDSVLAKYGKTAFDITLANVTPASNTNMTWSRSPEKSRFGNETVKIQPTADTGCIMHFASMAMTCDPDDLLYTVDVWVDTLPPTHPATTPIMTITLSPSAALGANYDAWTFDNSNLRQGWNTLKMWAGDDLTGGYRDSNMPQGCTRITFSSV